MYRERGEGWDAATSAEEFFQGRLEGRYLPEPRPAQLQAALYHAAAGAAILLAVALLILLGSWKIKDLFRRYKPAPVGLTTALSLLPEKDAPAACRPTVRLINGAVKDGKVSEAVQKAEETARDRALLDSFRQSPQAYQWLVEVLVAGHMLLASQDRVKTQDHYLKAIQFYEKFGKQMTDPGWNSLFCYCWALFEKSGGATLDPIRAKDSRDVLDAVSLVYKNHPTLPEASPKLQFQLWKIEGYTLARVLTSQGHWWRRRRFDPGNTANRGNWLRLDDLLIEWGHRSTPEKDRDLVCLRLWFWQTVQTFSFGLPVVSKKEMYVGDRQYSMATADEQTRRLRAIMEGGLR